eukprot:IDg21336t1
MSANECLPCTFSGLYLERDNSGSILQRQNFYVQKLENLPLTASLTQFRSMRMRLAWLANTHPECLFEILQLAQVAEDRFNENKSDLICLLNEATKFATDYHITLKTPKLDKNSLRIISFSDVTFANHDLSTEIGYIFFLADSTGSSAPIVFKYYKSKRVVRSAMAGEVIAFSDFFDRAETLAAEISDMLGKRIPVQLLTESKNLFDVIFKASRTSEKRTTLYIAAASEGFRDKMISDIGFEGSSHNLADGLTKQIDQAAFRDF